MRGRASEPAAPQHRGRHVPATDDVARHHVAVLMQLSLPKQRREACPVFSSRRGSRLLSTPTRPRWSVVGQSAITRPKPGQAVSKSGQVLSITVKPKPAPKMPRVICARMPPCGRSTSSAGRAAPVNRLASTSSPPLHSQHGRGCARPLAGCPLQQAAGVGSSPYAPARELLGGGVRHATFAQSVSRGGMGAPSTARPERFSYGCCLARA